MRRTGVLTLSNRQLWLNSHLIMSICTHMKTERETQPPVDLFLEHVLFFKANSCSCMSASYGGSLQEDQHNEAALQHIKQLLLQPFLHLHPSFHSKCGRLPPPSRPAGHPLAAESSMHKVWGLILTLGVRIRPVNQRVIRYRYREAARIRSV